MNNNNFWQLLPKPFTVLAPMEDVTDTVFRRMVIHMGRPDVFFTEFTSVDGLVSEGQQFVAKRLHYTKEEHPIVAQVWGSDPNKLYEATKLVAGMGFDGIDLNLGCPERSVLKHGSGGALIGQYSLVKELVEAMKEGIEENVKCQMTNDKSKDIFQMTNDKSKYKLQITNDKFQTNSNNQNSKKNIEAQMTNYKEKHRQEVIPLSIKTRIGNNQIITEEWISFLLTLPIDVITIHGRTVKELSDVSAHWDEIGKAVQIRNRINPDVVIIGNGDVMSYGEVLEKHMSYGVDGVMVGRGIFGNPHIFRKDGSNPDKTLRLHYLLHHLQLFQKQREEMINDVNDKFQISNVKLIPKHQQKNSNSSTRTLYTIKLHKNYAAIKKFFKMYVHGWEGAKAQREKLMETKTTEEAMKIIETYEEKLKNVSSI